MISVGVQVAIVKVKPYDTLRGNRVALFNEVTVSLYVYMLLGIAYQNPVPDTVGYILIGIIACSFLVNLRMFLIGLPEAFRSALSKARIKKEPDYKSEISGNRNSQGDLNQ